MPAPASQAIALPCVATTRCRALRNAILLPRCTGGHEGDALSAEGGLFPRKVRLALNSQDPVLSLSATCPAAAGLVRHGYSRALSLPLPRLKEVSRCRA